jgi:hypothetical protein
MFVGFSNMNYRSNMDYTSNMNHTSNHTYSSSYDGALGYSPERKLVFSSSYTLAEMERTHPDFIRQILPVVGGSSDLFGEIFAILASAYMAVQGIVAMVLTGGNATPWVVAVGSTVSGAMISASISGTHYMCSTANCLTGPKLLVRMLQLELQLGQLALGAALQLGQLALRAQRLLMPRP